MGLSLPATHPISHISPIPPYPWPVRSWDRGSWREGKVPRDSRQAGRGVGARVYAASWRSTHFSHYRTLKSLAELWGVSYNKERDARSVVPPVRSLVVTPPLLDLDGNIFAIWLYGMIFTAPTYGSRKFHRFRPPRLVGPSPHGLSQRLDSSEQHHRRRRVLAILSLLAASTSPRFPIGPSFPSNTGSTQAVPLEDVSPAACSTGTVTVF